MAETQMAPLGSGFGVYPIVIVAFDGHLLFTLFFQWTCKSMCPLSSNKQTFSTTRAFNVCSDLKQSKTICAPPSHNSTPCYLLKGLVSTPAFVSSRTERTIHFFPGKPPTLFLVSGSTSPDLRFLFVWFNCCLSCSKGRYSRIQRFQKRTEMYWTCFHLRFTYRSWDSNNSGGNGLGFPFH